MEAIGSFFGSLMIPAAVAALIIVVLAVLGRMLKNNYIKVPPHEVAVVSGRKHRMTVKDGSGAEQTIEVGYRLIKGGAAFVWPFFERVDRLDLREITIPDLEVSDAITEKGVKLTVKAVANIKIGSEDTLLSNAVERLLGKEQHDIKDMAYQTLEAHLRSILGTLTIEQINNDRAAFQQRMITESQSDLAKLGLKIDNLSVKDLSDKSGYLDALGKQRTAEVKRDADIGEAEAKRESTIRATTAHQQGETQNQANLALEAEAQKKTNVQKAEYDAETRAATARAEQAGPLATAQARREVVIQEQAVELARTQEATKVAEAEAARKAQELQATVVRPAEADREAAIAKAEGVARAKIIEAEAGKQAAALAGEGEAAAIRAKMQAEADGTRAKLLAEAEGILKKAEAYEKLNQSGQLLQILEALQTLVPNALEKFEGVMGAAAAPLGHADKIVMIDSGGGTGAGGSAVQRYADLVPGLVLGTMEKAKAMGVDLSGLLSKFGVTMDAATPASTAGAPAKSETSDAAAAPGTGAAVTQ